MDIRFFCLEKEEIIIKNNYNCIFKHDNRLDLIKIIKLENVILSEYNKNFIYPDGEKKKNNYYEGKLYYETILYNIKLDDLKNLFNYKEFEKNEIFK